eukprot:gene60-60_t
MQGNIRVMCRIRPITAQERAHRPELTPSVLDGISSIRDYNYLHFGGVPYEFDRVFSADVSQDEIYIEVLPMIEGVMNGCRACIFAYGQTGSGKTFTMEGPAHDRGISYRAVKTLFSISEHERSKYSTEVVVSILEVYNEKVIDLLSPEGKCTPVSDPSDRNSLEIRAGKDGVYVEGLGQWRASSPDDVYQLMERGLARRQVACNNINEHSSRSHLVITIKVTRVHFSTRHVTVGSLYLVDLAGSERIKHTTASGRRMKEAQHISKSLSAIGNVIAALASNHKHVPYRDSKLTFLLQDALRDHSQVLMVVNVSPLPEYVSESTFSLQFAARCRSVELGQSKRAISYAEPVGSTSPLPAPVTSLPPSQQREGNMS